MSAATLEAFREAVAEDVASSQRQEESTATRCARVLITLRHTVHPNHYALAWELMALCAVATGVPLDEDGVWPPARGQVWCEPSRLPPRPLP